MIDALADAEDEDDLDLSAAACAQAVTGRRTRCGCGPSGKPVLEQERKQGLKAAALAYREMLERLRMAQGEQKRALAGQMSMQEMVDLSSKLGLCKDGFKDVVRMCGELSETCPPHDEERRTAILAVQAEACFSLGEVYECPQTPGSSSVARLAALSYESGAELFREIANAGAEKKTLERVLQLCLRASGDGGAGDRDLRRALRVSRRLSVLSPDSDAAKDNVAVIGQELAREKEREAGGGRAPRQQEDVMDLQCSMQITAHGRELVVSRACAF